MSSFTKILILVSLIGIANSANVVAQKTEMKNTRMSVEYYKSPDKTEFLVATLRVKEDRYLPLVDVEIKFKNVIDTTSVELGKARTNEYGEAKFVITDPSKIEKDSLGELTFEVEYAGSKMNKMSKRKVTVKRANLEMSFFQKDSTKYIEVSVTENDDRNTPIEDIEVELYIKGTFSNLSFESKKTDNQGKIQVEFPTKMPGDSLGVLVIVSRIEEDKDYGTIEAKGIINWGKPVPLVKEKHRGLGDTDAPLWMVYTLIILLSIVWFHYMYVIFLFVKIKLTK